MEKIKFEDMERVNKWYDAKKYVPEDERVVVGFLGDRYILCRYVHEVNAWFCGLFKEDAPQLWTILPRL